MTVPSRRGELDDLYREHFARLVRVAFLMTGSSADAEDAVHEVFVRCVDRIGGVDHPASYLRAAVVNECRSAHRRRQRDQPAEPGVGDGLPHEALETRDALAALTQRQRAAVVLRYFVDVPDEEIAQILGCRPSTVRSLIRRAVRQLREALQ